MKLTEVGSKITNLKEIGMSSKSLNSQNMRLEVVVLPVSNVNRSKHFYEALRWRLDADFVSSGQNSE
jgi:hypothetical protein